MQRPFRKTIEPYKPAQMGGLQTYFDSLFGDLAFHGVGLLATFPASSPEHKTTIGPALIMFKQAIP